MRSILSAFAASALYAGAATAADGRIQRPLGIPGWNIRHALGNGDEQAD